MTTYSVAFGHRESRMKTFSIVRTGNEYILQASHKSVLKTASKRRALRLARCAEELLKVQSASVMVPEETIAPEHPEVS
jgi:hypothetical protein